VVKVGRAICVKGQAIPEIINSPDRLLHPMRRVGERGQGKWERISWDEALDEAADRFREIIDNYGVEAIGVYSGDSHHAHLSEIAPIFTRSLKLPNRWGAAQMCMFPHIIAEVATHGPSIMTDVGPDVWHANCIIVWASSPTEGRPYMGKAILDAKNQRRAKLIVVNPRPTPEARIADVWLRIRPGTDCALALGMMNVIINEELYDKDFVEKWCIGFDKLKERVQKYPPESTAEICWVQKEKIIEAARMYATIKPSCIHARVGTQAQINSTQTSRAICSLMFLAGNIDVEGGNLYHNPLGGFRRTPRAKLFMDTFWNITREAANPRRIGAKEFPLYCETFLFSQNAMSWRTVHEGKIKGMLIPCSNPVISDVNSRYIWEALKKLDWLAVMDIFMTPTAELADIIFPGCTWWEVEGGPKESFRPTSTSPGYFIWSDKLIEPPGECRDEREVIIDLLKRMGSKPIFNTLEEYFDWRLRSLNTRYKDLKVKYPDKMVTFPPPPFKRYERRGFNTPSGKVELYSSLFERLGYDPLPDHKEPPQSPISTPETFKEYPLILVTYRDVNWMKSEGRNIPSLRKRRPDPTLEINPLTAQQLGIKEGDKVWFETPAFKGVQVKAKAELVPELDPRVVATCIMWWLPEMPGPEHGCFEVSVNTILTMDPPYDPIQGTPAVKNVLCKIGKA